MTRKKPPPAESQGTPTGAAAPSEPSAQTATPPSPAEAVSPPALPAGLQSLAKLMNAWKARHRRPPDILYHYTNAQGLYGMLSTGRVWGTNVGFLNDPSEMHYAAQLIRNVMTEEVKQLKAEQPPAEEKKSGWRGMVDVYADSMSTSLPAWTESLLKTFEDQGDAYMTCFCARDNLLSQWRGYGATGSGYALGFDARQIGTPAPAAGGVLLRRVIYKPKAQIEIVRNWVREFFRLGQSLVQAMREQIPEQSVPATNFMYHLFTAPGIALSVIGRAATNKQLLAQGQQVFTKFLAECLICFKDPAYQEEEEWRVIQNGQNAGIKFRPSGPRVVPYIELALTPLTDDKPDARLPLKSITYGPTLEPAVTEKSLAMLLEHHKYNQPAIEIKRSGIPFRPEAR